MKRGDASIQSGTILVAHAIIEAIGEGATAFDFLRGREDYKYRWGAVDRVIYRKHVTRATAFSGTHLSAH